MVILGAGESGTGAAVLGVTQNWDVFVSDRGKIAPKYQDELNIHNIAWEQEQHTEEKILGADLIIKSPGIPDKAPLVVAAKAKGMTEAQFHELMAVVSLANETNRLATGYRIPVDEAFRQGFNETSRAS